GQYPAINILKSISRVMPQIVDDIHMKHAQEMRHLMGIYEEKSDLIQIGAYKHGTDPDIDKAILYQPSIISFLKQSTYEEEYFQDSIKKMKQLIDGEDN